MIVPAPQRTICIVESDPATADWIEEVLSSSGIRTTMAASAAAASNLLCECSPDLILIDHNLPDEPGTDLCARLVHSARCGRIPIVLMSDLPAKKALKLKKSCGAVDLLLKPFSTRELLQGVHAWSGLPDAGTCNPCPTCLEP